MPTPRQLDALACIERHYVAHGYPPTLAEIAKSLGVARQTAHEHVLALVSKGLVARAPGKSRTWVPKAANTGKAGRHDDGESLRR